MQTYSERIADFATGLSLDSIPSEVIERVKMHILDTIGVAFVSVGDAFARAIIDGFGKLGSNPESGVFGTGERFSREYAACANASLVHGIDFDDTHIPGATHPGACIIPTALAVGEVNRATGKRFLESVVLGYEVMTRIGMASNGLFHDKGFHGTPLCGTFGSCLAAGKIENISAPQLVNALGICGSQAAGMQQFLADGTWVKKFHPGWAAHSGIIAALLAANGLTGPAEVFEGKAGLFATHVDKTRCDLSTLTGTLGSEWETLRTSIKLYPSCQFTHTFINCALYLKDHYDIHRDDIQRITCRVSPRGAMWTCEPIEKRQNVTSPYEGRFSLPFTVATALLKGKVGLEQFEDRFIEDRDIQKCAKKVDFVIDEKLSGKIIEFSGDLTVELKNGHKYRHMQKYDHEYSNRYLDTNGTVNKFKANMNVSKLCDEDRAGKIIASIEGIEGMGDIGELASLLS